jgi:geranylgeranyl pyrophosphate synthase
LLLEMQGIFRAAKIFDHANDEIAKSYSDANQVLDRFPRPQATQELRYFTDMLLNRRS